MAKRGRPTEFEGAWLALASAYGGPKKLAKVLGVAYQNVWRWARRDGKPSGAARRAIERLAEAKGLPSPIEASCAPPASDEAMRVADIFITRHPPPMLSDDAFDAVEPDTSTDPLPPDYLGFDGCEDDGGEKAS